MSKSWIYSWLWKFSRTRQQPYRSASFAMNTDISYEWINCQKPHLTKNGIRIPCNTEKFVPIVVPGLSTSSSSSSHSSTSMTPLRQENDHPTSSSSSSTSPPTTVSSDSETRAREDLCRTDAYPVPVSSPNVEEMIERWDPLFAARPAPLCSDIPEWLQELREDLVDDRVPDHRDSHASSSHEVSLEPTPTRSEDLGKHSVSTHFPKDRNCEICQRTKITRGPVQKTQWRSRASCRKFWWLDNSRSQSSQWKLWISKQSSICNRGAGFGHPMDPVVSVHNKNFSGNTKELAKVLGAR